MIHYAAFNAPCPRCKQDSAGVATLNCETPGISRQTKYTPYFIFIGYDKEGKKGQDNSKKQRQGKQEQKCRELMILPIDKRYRPRVIRQPT